MLFEDYSESAPTLAAIVHLISEEAVGDSNSVDKEPQPAAALEPAAEGESIENPSLRVTPPPAQVPVESATDNVLMTAIRAAYDTDDTIKKIFKAKAEGAQQLPHSLITEMRLKIELKDCEVRDRLVYFRKRLVIPFNNNLREEIVQRFHNTPSASHGGKRPTYYLVSQHYY